MFQTRLSALALAALLAMGRGGPLASGQEPTAASPTEAQRLLSQWDRNGDRALARGELAPEHRLLFERLLRTGDGDADGQLAAEELEAALTVVRPEKRQVEKQGSRLPGADALVVMLAQMDANGDRRIVAGEVPARWKAAFTRALQQADDDKNGLLDSREINQGGPRLTQLAVRSAAELRLDVPAELAGLPPERVQMLNQDPLARWGELLADPAKAGELFAQFDADGDGYWTAAEMPPPLAERFPQLLRRRDRDGDGRLSRREFTDSAARFRQFRGRPRTGPARQPPAPPAPAQPPSK